jgi:stress-induced morphogen
MNNEFPSLDELFLSDRKSIYVFRLTGKRMRIGMQPKDLLIVDRSLEHKAGKPALVVVNGNFQIQIISPEFLKRQDPDKGDFIWGMVQTIVRELE